MGGYSDRMREMSPPPLQSDPRFVQGIGTGLDRLLSNFKDAIKARFPTYAADNADAYALANIGADSSMPRYPSETDAQYGARLQARWLLYARAGAAASPTDPTTYPNPIVHELEGLGFGDVTIMEYIDWPADATNPQVHHSPEPWYDMGGVLGVMILGEGVLGSPWWSRFWVYVGSYNGATIPVGGTLGVGVLGTMYLGFELPSGVISSAVAAILQWKPAHALCPYLAVLVGGTPIDSVLGIGVLGTMVLGVGGGSGAFVIEINK